MRYRRDRTQGGCYFFTLVTMDRQPLLTLPENLERLQQGFHFENQRRSFQIDGLIVLPDHLHCILKLPENDDNYLVRITNIKKYFSMGCKGISAEVTSSRRAKGEKPVWQRRYWEHRIRDQEDWKRHMDYIHYNPVKHGYVQSPLDWSSSTLKDCISKGWYPENWGESIDSERMKDFKIPGNYE